MLFRSIVKNEIQRNRWSVFITEYRKTAIKTYMPSNSKHVAVELFRVLNNQRSSTVLTLLQLETVYIYRSFNPIVIPVHVCFIRCSLIVEKNNPLSVAERDTLRNANDRFCYLRRDEETKWAQKAKVKHIQEGGNNTKYFHLVANGKHRKKKKFQLEQEEGTIIGQENLKTYSTP